jgi:hypothetical protein
VTVCIIHDADALTLRPRATIQHCGAAGSASEAKGVTGPTTEKMPAGQILIEREDTLFLVTEAGTGSAFHADGKRVATILSVQDGSGEAWRQEREQMFTSRGPERRGA